MALSEPPFFKRFGRLRTIRRSEHISNIGHFSDFPDDLLAPHGFRKRAGDIFTLDVGQDVLGWLGLNRASKHHPAGEVAINPVIGVRHQETERVVADLRGDTFRAYIPPTSSTPLGYLLPEHRLR